MPAKKGKDKKPKEAYTEGTPYWRLLGYAVFISLIIAAFLFLSEQFKWIPTLTLQLIPAMTLAENVLLFLGILILAIFSGLVLIFFISSYGSRDRDFDVEVRVRGQPAKNVNIHAKNTKVTHYNRGITNKHVHERLDVDSLEIKKPRK